VVTGVRTAWAVAAAVPDPELPMLTLADLGILRHVQQQDDAVTVTITPTYSGCPAMREISRDLQRRLREAGFAEVTVRTSLAPPWSSDWITPAGREKLASAGVAPPNAAPPATPGPIPLTLQPRRHPVTCPSCGADGAELTSSFSGTACKALYRCGSCAEPFEYVKEI
jgi:ring-1,2-phenylacetyl-CoA epoxidase subunit PaaD